MTALQDLLEDFGLGRPAPDDAPMPTENMVNESEVEGQKLEAFEKGYRAGWDDAVKAYSDERSHLSAGLGQHLQDLSFTYHEAYGQMMKAVNPLLNEMVTVLLPQVARAALGVHIAEQLEQLTAEIGGAAVEIAVSPNKLEAVSELLDGDFGFPLRLVPDDTLSDEQADIRFGEQERQIDLGELIASVIEAVQGFAYENQRKFNHG